jgi:hypothetical protein
MNPTNFHLRLWDRKNQIETSPKMEYKIRWLGLSAALKTVSHNSPTLTDAVLTLKNKNENKDIAWQCTYNINFMTMFLVKTVLSVRKYASFRRGLCTCMSPTSEWILYSQSQVLKGFYHSQGLKEPYAQLWAQLSPGFLAALLSGIMIFVGYFRVANAFPFSLHSPPSVRVWTAVESVPPLSFLPLRCRKGRTQERWNLAGTRVFVLVV